MRGGFEKRKEVVHQRSQRAWLRKQQTERDVSTGDRQRALQRVARRWATLYRRQTQRSSYQLHLLIGWVLSLLFVTLAVNLPIYPRTHVPVQPAGQIDRMPFLPEVMTTPVPIAPEVPDVRAGGNDRTAPQRKEPSEEAQPEVAPVPPPVVEAAKSPAIEEEAAAWMQPATAMALAPLALTSRLDAITSIRPDWMIQHTYEQKDVEVQPEWKNAVRIRYPYMAQKRRIEGRLLLAFTVEMDGTTSHVRVIRRSHPLLDNEAVRALKGARFIPGRHDGEPVRVQVTLHVVFRLH